MITESHGPQLPGPDPVSSAGTGDARSGDADRRTAVAATVAQRPVDPVLCHHCGRTASNGIGCQGICVADSGY